MSEEKKSKDKETKNGSIRQKLHYVQQNLKAPKGQYNKFGKYNYRSCEDILEAVKPLLIKLEVVLKIDDEIILIGDRYYVKSTVLFCDINNLDIMSSQAFAREPLVRKGMDDSQITGTAGSYARKYALNGLFAIDDNKDADAQLNGKNGDADSDKKPPMSSKKIIDQAFFNFETINQDWLADQDGKVEFNRALFNNAVMKLGKGPPTKPESAEIISKLIKPADVAKAVEDK